MKSLIVLAMAFSSVAFGKITVQMCNVSRIKLEVKAFATQNMTVKGPAVLSTKMNGRSIVDTKEAKYMYLTGSEAESYIRSNAAAHQLAKVINASTDDLRKGISVYSYGNLEDDAAGVVYIVFYSVRGKMAQAIFHGWAGPQKCDSY